MRGPVALLAGTAEARALAGMLAAEGVPAVASLAGETREPAPLPIPTRHGGFGGDAAFAGWLRGVRASALVDATHPFAAAMSRRAADVACAMGLPHCQVLRPGWREGPGDRWSRVAREEDAAALIPPGATVLLATGRRTLERFAGLDARLLCRRIDPPDGPFPWPRGDWLVGRAPFTVAGEAALMERLGVDWLVVKDSGGEGAAPKLVAARALGLPVAMIERPPQPPCERVEDAVAAMGWLRSLDRDVRARGAA